MSERWHFIGVGGSGMSAVARLIAATGVEVTGTDRRESAYFLALRDAGMDVRVGHDPGLVDAADAVVISTAVREDNEELARARETDTRVLHRSEALVAALEGQRLVAVAGSHGKTTTSAMVAHALHGAGVDASFAVGARVLGVDGAVAGGYAGSAGIAVVEADESDGSFLRYHPEVAIVLNIEPDHLDFYGTVENLHASFARFAQDCRTLVACADDPVTMRIAQAAAQSGVEVITYGAAGASRDDHGEPDVVVDDSSLIAKGVAYPLEVPIPGAHQRLNAAAAWAAAVAIGAEPTRAARALATFGGTGRRFELRGEAAGVRVIDDYAHHPTEVAAVLAAARDAGAERLVVLFQPALFSRTQLHATNFAAALSVDNAHVVIAGVHGDREDPIPGVTSASILEAMSVPENSTAQVVEDLAEAAQVAASLAQPGDLVLTVGSGTVTQAAGWILDALAARPDHG